MDMNVVFPVAALVVVAMFFVWGRLSGQITSAPKPSLEAYSDLAERRGWGVTQRSDKRGYRQIVLGPAQEHWTLVVTVIEIPGSVGGAKGFRYDVEWKNPLTTFEPGEVLIGPSQSETALKLAGRIVAFSQTGLGRAVSSYHRLPGDMTARHAPGDLDLSIMANTDAFSQLPLHAIADRIRRWQMTRPEPKEKVVMRIGPQGLAVRFWGSKHDAESIEALADLAIELRPILQAHLV